MSAKQVNFEPPRPQNRGVLQLENTSNMKLLLISCVHSARLTAVLLTISHVAFALKFHSAVVSSIQVIMMLRAFKRAP